MKLSRTDTGKTVLCHLATPTHELTGDLSPNPWHPCMSIKESTTMQWEIKNQPPVGEPFTSGREASQTTALQSLICFVQVQCALLGHKTITVHGFNKNRKCMSWAWHGKLPTPCILLAEGALRNLHNDVNSSTTWVLSRCLQHYQTPLALDALQQAKHVCILKPLKYTDRGKCPLHSQVCRKQKGNGA